MRMRNDYDEEEDHDDIDGDDNSDFLIVSRGLCQRGCVGFGNLDAL